MGKLVRIGTRESRLAVWQATEVMNLLAHQKIKAELVFIKSEGDIDLQTPLYEMGVQGIFTKSLDIALLNNRIDIAVHSMKDVPTQLPNGIIQAAVLKRGNSKDLLVYRDELETVNRELSMANDKKKISNSSFIVATSSIRRKAQWLNRYPEHQIENLRGNVNSRLQKLKENSWNGAIFAAAGLERINLRPEKAIELDWMLPAPAQGAIMVVCRENDLDIYNDCRHLHDDRTAQCTKIERDFLRALLGGCSTPIAAFAEIEKNEIYFRGNILTPDGSQKAEIEKKLPLEKMSNLGKIAAEELLINGGKKIIEQFHHAEK
ncbi:MAG TPA: hydroxymethylbilane synthase [Puia sp.]|nr:hydroxymethylbilane synthase [Puia sp.]